MDAAAPVLDLSHASVDIITTVFQSMYLTDRFTCALVCKAWAETAAMMMMIHPQAQRKGSQRLAELAGQAWTTA